MAIAVSTINITRTLRELWLHPGISRVELSELLSLNKSSITKIIQDLMDNRMVIAGAEGVPSPRGGRKPVALNLNPGFGNVLGVEINNETIRISCLDFTGREKFKVEEPLRPTGNQEVLLSPAETAGRAFGLAGKTIPLSSVLGAAVTVPGIVNGDTGTIEQSIPLNIHKPYPFLQEIQKIHPFPLYLENDANCCCWNELLRNGGEERGDFLYILGGIQSDGPVFGMGIALKGHVHHGEDFSAGEFRSVFNVRNRECQLNLTPDERSLFFARPALRKKALEELARNTALIVNVLNLKKVVLGGFFHSLDESHEALFKKEIMKNNSYPELAEIKVCLSDHGLFAAAHGAASLVMEKLYNISGQFGPEFLSA